MGTAHAGEMERARGRIVAPSTRGGRVLSPAQCKLLRAAGDDVHARRALLAQFRREAGG